LPKSLEKIFFYDIYIRNRDGISLFETRCKIVMSWKWRWEFKQQFVMFFSVSKKVRYTHISTTVCRMRKNIWVVFFASKRYQLYTFLQSSWKVAVRRFPKKVVQPLIYDRSYSGRYTEKNSRVHKVVFWGVTKTNCFFLPKVTKFCSKRIKEIQKFSPNQGFLRKLKVYGDIFQNSIKTFFSPLY
jgi:hypothetical protein